MSLDKSDSVSLPDTNIGIDNNNYYSDVFTPGEVKEQLRIGKEVRGNLMSTSIVFTTITSGTTGNVSITGAGFTPKSVRIQAVDWLGLSGSDCSSDGTNTGGVRTSQLYPSSNGIGIARTTSRIIDLDYTDTGTQQLFATFVSFGTDGATINVGTNSYSGTTNLVVTFMG